MTEDHSLEKRRQAPYWWPETQTVMQLFLAAAIVAMVGYILQQLLSGEALKIDPSVRDLIVFIFGIVFGNFKDVYSFTFGSSASDKTKGDVINKSIENKDKIIAAGVVATAATAAVAAAAADDKGQNVAQSAIPIAVVSWWSLLTPEEQFAIETKAKDSPEIQPILTAFKSGKATDKDLADLVSMDLLTQDRSDEIKGKQPKVTT